MDRLQTLTSRQVERELDRLDRLDRRVDLGLGILAAVLFLMSAALYAGVVLFALHGNDPATTGCVAFASLTGGAGLWLARTVGRRRRTCRRRTRD